MIPALVSPESLSAPSAEDAPVLAEKATGLQERLDEKVK